MKSGGPEALRRGRSFSCHYFPYLEIDSKSFEHADQRVGFRKEQLGEDEAGDNAV